MNYDREQYMRHQAAHHEMIAMRDPDHNVTRKHTTLAANSAKREIDRVAVAAQALFHAANGEAALWDSLSSEAQARWWDLAHATINAYDSA